MQGTVDLRELFDGMQLAAHGPIEDRARFFFKVFDSDHSGELDNDEVYTMLANGAGPNMDREQLDSIFSLIDEDGDGSITEEEFVKAIINDPSLLRWISHVFGRAGFGQDMPEEPSSESSSDSGSGDGEEDLDGNEGDGETRDVLVPTPTLETVSPRNYPSQSIPGKALNGVSVGTTEAVAVSGPPAAIQLRQEPNTLRSIHYTAAAARRHRRIKEKQEMERRKALEASLQQQQQQQQQQRPPPIEPPGAMQAEEMNVPASPDGFASSASSPDSVRRSKRRRGRSRTPKTPSSFPTHPSEIDSSSASPPPRDTAGGRMGPRTSPTPPQESSPRRVGTTGPVEYRISAESLEARKQGIASVRGLGGHADSVAKGAWQP